MVVGLFLPSEYAVERSVVIQAERDTVHAHESTGAMTYGAADTGETRVNWRMAGDSGFDLVGCYFGLLMDSMVGPMFERGFERLKARVEAG